MKDRIQEQLNETVMWVEVVRGWGTQFGSKHRNEVFSLLMSRVICSTI